MSKTPTPNDAMVPTGVAGLDEVLLGGLPASRLYLVEGHPGSGKTTLALQFLLEGVRRGEKCMFVALSENREELVNTAASHGWSLDGIHIFEVSASEAGFGADARYTMYHPSEVELGETIRSVFAEATRVDPSRLVFDSLSELRLLADNALRYRRQILALKQHFARQKATVLLIDDRTSEARDMHLHSLAHGVVSLERMQPEYGAMRRRLQIVKMRGASFREGYHDFALRRGGMVVFPRLVAAEHRAPRVPEPVRSGIEAMDRLLGGGLGKGTSTLILGAAGTGKSTLAAHYAYAMARRGGAADVFLFDESVASWLERSAGLGIDMGPLIESGAIIVRQIDPAELSPGEFAGMVRRDVEQHSVQLVVIDSLTGFLNAMPSDRYLVLHLHELLMYLGQRGVTTLLLMTQHGLVDATAQVPIDTSYLADAVVLIRYFEAFGEIRQALSVVKKRTGRHERTIRELGFDHGIHIGEPIREFHGVLSGQPTVVAEAVLQNPPNPERR